MFDHDPVVPQPKRVGEESCNVRVAPVHGRLRRVTERLDECRFGYEERENAGNILGIQPVVVRPGEQLAVADRRGRGPGWYLPTRTSADQREDARKQPADGCGDTGDEMREGLPLHWWFRLYSAAMTANPPVDALKSAVKQAIGLARESRWEEFYSVYGQLFADPAFATNRPEDQRQALKLMIMTKGLPAPTSQAGVHAYQSAWYALSRLVSELRQASDYELLGITHLRLGDEPGAQKVFQAGLEVAQAANDGDTCGIFLRHLANF